MADIWSKEKRSEVMSRIRGKNTKPETLIRSALHKLGYRFRLHKKGLPGKPDIVLSKYRTVIFVNGCFWHYHKNCKAGIIPKSRTEWWREKLTKTVERDKLNYKKLDDAGWRVLVLWECDIEKDLNRVMSNVIRAL